MALQLVSRAAVDGKRPVNKPGRTSEFFAKARRLTFAAAAFLLTAVAASPSSAQSSAFASMAGTWSGPGTVMLDDGSSERIRCRATYKVSGASMEMSLTCASDAYKFNLQAAVAAAGGEVSGTWTETSRNVGGSIQGRGANGSFQVVAQARTQEMLESLDRWLSHRDRDVNPTVKGKGRLRVGLGVYHFEERLDQDG